MAKGTKASLTPMIGAVGAAALVVFANWLQWIVHPPIKAMEDVVVAADGERVSSMVTC